MGKVKIMGEGCTHIGHNRNINQDYFDMHDFVFVLADGMGGHNAGEIASKLAIESIMRSYHEYKYSESIHKYKTQKIHQIIEELFQKANDTVLTESIQHTQYSGMGTTLVLALFQQPDMLHIANIGDSRAYLLRSNILKQLTEDHTVAADLVRKGVITISESKTHPYRHYLSKSIGTSKEIQPYQMSIRIIPEDKILLCSDGLWNVLSDETIKQELQKNNYPQTICKKMISRAYQSNSSDNITCIVLTFSKSKIK